MKMIRRAIEKDIDGCINLLHQVCNVHAKIRPDLFMKGSTKYNELDLVSLTDGEMYKFKCRIPIMAILEDLKYNGQDSDALNNINMLYKISTNNEKSA